MKIVVESKEEERCVRALVENMHHAWEMFGEHTDSYYLAFRNIRENDNEFKNDQVELMKALLQNINNVTIELSEIKNESNGGK